MLDSPNLDHDYNYVYLVHSRGDVGSFSWHITDSYGMIYTTNKNFSFHSPNFNYDGYAYGVSPVGGGYYWTVDNSYGLSEPWL